MNWLSRVIDEKRNCDLKKSARVCMILEASALTIALALGLFGIALENYTALMVAVTALWFACIIYCVQNLRTRVLLLAFDLVIFVFLMCRPLIDIVKNQTRWGRFMGGSVAFAIAGIAVSLLFLHAGSLAYERWMKKSGKAVHITCAPKGQQVKAFRLAAFLLYVFCLAFFVILEVEKLVYMQGRDYAEIYKGFQSSLPSIYYTISRMMPYALCVYLATLPKKRIAFFTLILYVLSAVPQLLIGARNPIVLNAIFCVLYYYIRDCIGDRKKWIGKKEKACLVVGIPAAAFFLSIWNYLRAGSEVASEGFFGAIVDLFYKQGVSFDVLCKGFRALPYLPGGPKCYTFGPFIDGILQSSIGQALFGATPFPAGNSAIRAVKGHSFAHSMSYVAHPTYLHGNGWGSSYILETYADFGWIGVALFSLLLGMALIWFMQKAKGTWVTRMVVLVCLTELLFIPRAEATGWLSFVITVHFWLAIAACVIGGWLITKSGLCKRLQTASYDIGEHADGEAEVVEEEDQQDLSDPSDAP